MIRYDPSPHAGSVRPRRDSATIPVYGPLDHEAAQRLREQALAQVRDGVRTVLVDLSGVPRWDAEMARELTEVRTWLLRRGGDLTVRMAGREVEVSDLPRKVRATQDVPTQRRPKHPQARRPETADQP
jgi:anti-anti-sigma regulatory factor